jgi:hypothetical protein
MKKLIITLLAATAIGAVAAPAMAQPGWRSINERQRELDNRIDDGVRRGCLTRIEAVRLRTEFQRIVYLERDYRRSGSGLTSWERRDLDMRLDRLQQDIGRQCRDGDDRWDGSLPWENINQRQRRLDDRIDRGVRRGCLSSREADRLRTEFRNIARLENDYRRTGGGLNSWERQDLDRRFDRLAADIKRQCNDGDWR